MSVPSMPVTAWMVIPTFHPVVGGAQRQALQLSKVLVSRRWPVQVLTRRHSYAHPAGLPARSTVDGIPVRRLYSRGATRFGSLLYVLGGLVHLALHGRRGVYHAHDIGAAGWLAVVAARLLGGRSLVKLRTGCDVYRRHFGRGFARWQFTALLRLADRVVVVNGEAEQFVSSFGIPRSRVLLLPNATDVEYFRPPSAAERAAARRGGNLPADGTLVLYAGRFEYLKGVDILLQAWAQIPRTTRERARLVLVGDGPQTPQLVALIESLGMREAITIRGFTDTVRDYYWAADLFVLPSRTEGLSNALVEAMATGLPVVASAVGGARDLIQDGVQGHLVQAEDHHALAAALAPLLTDRRRLSALGCQARERVVARAAARALDGVAAVYRNLWSAGSGG